MSMAPFEEHPAEIWLLRDFDSGKFVVTADECRGHETYVAAFSEEAADAACEHQLQTYNVDCHPVRVFPPFPKAVDLDSEVA